MSVTVADLHWLAGFMDGEGYFGRRPTSIAVSVSQKDEWHIRKVQGLLGGKPSHYPNKFGERYWRLDYTGAKAAAIMMTLYVLMSPRRQERIEECIKFWKELGKRGSHFRSMTHCKQGHEYTEENTYRKPKAPTHRYCKKCISAYHKNRNKKI